MHNCSWLCFSIVLCAVWILNGKIHQPFIVIWKTLRKMSLWQEFYLLSTLRELSLKINIAAWSYIIVYIKNTKCCKEFFLLLTIIKNWKSTAVLNNLVNSVWFFIALDVHNFYIILQTWSPALNLNVKCCGQNMCSGL